jgi:hypothetical protein
MAAWFQMKDDDDGSMPPFVIELHDPAVIDHARRILSGAEKAAVHIMGTIIKSKAPYNPDWSFHLDPPTISFWQLSTEVCDASTRYVEDNLADIGEAALPGNHWCPWSSRIVSEVSSRSA